jgi:hypothetical protein
MWNPAYGYWEDHGGYPKLAVFEYVSGRSWGTWKVAWDEIKANLERA